MAEANAVTPPLQTAAATLEKAKQLVRGLL